jgi:uncharacterized protein YcnI
MRTRVLRSPALVLCTSTLVGAIVFLLAGPAAAHVTVDPPSAPQGATVKLSFLVPNEEPDVKVTKVEIVFPTPPDSPIAGVVVGQKPGWTARVTMQTLTKPIVTDDGSITKVVREIDWTAKTLADAIGANEFGEFAIDADGLPTDESQMAFKALQTYSNGDVVRWIDPVTPGAPAADHPTPILELTKPTQTTTPTTSPPISNETVAGTTTKDNNARALAIIAVALGAVAMVTATGALMRRRRPA